MCFVVDWERGVWEERGWVVFEVWTMRVAGGLLGDGGTRKGDMGREHMAGYRKLSLCVDCWLWKRMC